MARAAVTVMTSSLEMRKPPSPSDGASSAVVGWSPLPVACHACACTMPIRQHVHVRHSVTAMQAGTMHNPVSDASGRQSSDRCVPEEPPPPTSGGAWGAFGERDVDGEEPGSRPVSSVLLRGTKRRRGNTCLCGQTISNSAWKCGAVTTQHLLMGRHGIHGRLGKLVHAPGVASKAVIRMRCGAMLLLCAAGCIVPESISTKILRYG